MALPACRALERQFDAGQGVQNDCFRVQAGGHGLSRHGAMDQNVGQPKNSLFRFEPGPHVAPHKKRPKGGLVISRQLFGSLRQPLTALRRFLAFES